MREILFRGKRYNGDWEYGVPLISGDTAFITQINSYSHLVIPNTIGQYVGLLDKDGQKIFEGDIIVGYWNEMRIVYFDADYLQFRVREISAYAMAREIDYFGEPKIIGNIYDNPELLGGTING